MEKKITEVKKIIQVSTFLLYKVVVAISQSFVAGDVGVMANIFNI